MKILVVANRKGGVGKTLLTTHAAWWFAERNLRVLVIDLDTQANTSRTLDATIEVGEAIDFFEPQASFYHDLAPGCIHLMRATDRLDAQKSKGPGITTNFCQNIAKISSKFDVCVIDTSPDQNFVNISALMAATHVVSPVNLGDYAVDGIGLLLKTIVGIKEKYNKNMTFIGLIPNMFVKNQPFQVQALRSLIEEYSQKYVFPATIGYRSAFEESVASKSPVWTNKKTAAREAATEMKTVLLMINERMGLS